jgi:hypothetical protein
MQVRFVADEVLLKQVHLEVLRLNLADMCDSPDQAAHYHACPWSKFIAVMTETVLGSSRIKVVYMRSFIAAITSVR